MASGETKHSAVTLSGGGEAYQSWCLERQSRDELISRPEYLYSCGVVRRQSEANRVWMGLVNVMVKHGDCYLKLNGILGHIIIGVVVVVACKGERGRSERGRLEREGGREGEGRGGREEGGGAA